MKTTTLFRRHLLALASLAALLFVSIPASAQTYVITNSGGTSYLAKSSNTAVNATTTFNPTTCLWTWDNTNKRFYIDGTTDYYLVLSTGNSPALSLTTTARSATTWNSASNLYYQDGNRYNYINSSLGGARTTNNSAPGTNSRATTYQVTTTTQSASISAPTVTGNTLLTSIGEYQFSASGSEYTEAYTNYRFNNTDHLLKSDGTEPASGTDGITYSYRLSSTNATVNSTTGLVTVNSLPANETSVTLTVTAHKDGYTDVSTQVTLVLNPSQRYVICYNNQYWLGGTEITPLTSFNPSTCLWTGTSGGVWKNNAGYYLRYGNYTLSLSSTNSTNWDITNTSRLRQTDNTSYYLRWSGSAWQRSNTNSNRDVLYPVTMTNILATSTNPAITGDYELSQTGTTTITYTPAVRQLACTDYVWNNFHHYSTDGTTSSSTQPKTNFTYSWSLSSEATGYATINNSGVISYNNYVSADREVTVTLTAHPNDGSADLTTTKTITLKPFIHTTTDPSRPYLYIFQGASNPTSAYAADLGNANQYVSLSSGGFSTPTSDASAFNDQVKAEYGWYFTDETTIGGTKYYHIYNYATGNYLFYDKDGAKSGFVEYRSGTATGDKTLFAAVPYSYGGYAGFAIIPYDAPSVRFNCSGGLSVTVYASNAASSVWNLVPVNLYKVVSTTPALFSYSAPTTSINPDASPISFGGNVRFSVSASDATLTVTRPSFQTLSYSLDNSTHYRYATNGSNPEGTMTITTTQPATRTAGWTGYGKTVSASQYQWQLVTHSSDDSPEAVAMLSINDRNQSQTAATTSANNVLVWQRLAHSSNASLHASLQAEAVYSSTDHFGVTSNYTAPAVFAAIEMPPFPVRVLSDNDQGSYTVYSHQNYYDGYLRPASNSSDNSPLATSKTNIDFAEYFWYIVPCDENVHVVNLFTRQFLYWNDDHSVVLKSTTDADISTLSEAEQRHYEWGSRLMQKADDESNQYLRIYPANSSAAGWCLAPDAANESSNIRLINIADIRSNPSSADSLFTFWKLGSATVSFVEPSLSNAAIDGNEVLTSTGSYPYSASGQIAPRHYSLRNFNYYVASTNPDGSSRSWARGTYPTQPRNFNSDPESQLSWNLDPAVPNVALSAPDNSASISYNTLVSDHNESTLKVTSVRYDGVTFSNPASLGITFGGNAVPTAIVAATDVMNIGRGFDASLNYTITPNYAYNFVKARITDGSSFISVEESASDGSISIHGSAQGTATLVLDAYQSNHTTVAASSQVVTIHVLVPADDPIFEDGTLETRRFHENKLRLTNNSASSSNKDNIYYFTGETPASLSDLPFVSAGDEIDISSYPHGTILHAIASGVNLAPSNVVDYTISRYEKPGWTPSPRNNNNTFVNPNKVADPSSNIFFTINGGDPVWVDDTIHHVNYLPDASNVQPYGDYFLSNTSGRQRVIGDHKYPSDVTRMTLSRYNKPILENFKPASSETTGSATFISDLGSCIAVNYNIYNSDNVLVNPNPFDPATYNFIVSSGNSSSLFSARNFKAIAFDCAITSASDDYEPAMFNSVVASFDNSSSNYWAFCHQADGSKFYLSVDPDTKTLRTVNQFDNSCLWYHDANHRLYVSLNGVNHYLTFNADALGLSTSAPSNIDWEQQGNSMVALRYESSLQSYVSSTLAFTSDNQWVCGAEGNTVVRFDVLNESLPNETRTELDQFNLTPLLSDNAGKRDEHYTSSVHKWIAFDTPGESFSFNLQPDLAISIHNYYACDRFYFLDANNQTHQYFFFNNTCYPVRADMPHTSRSGRSSSEDYVTFHWNISGDAAPYFSLAKTATWEDFTSHYTVTRSADPVSHPLEAQLVVSAVYEHDGVHMEVSAPAISLFAESKAPAIADNNGRPINPGEERYYRLVNYNDPTTLMHLNTEGSDNGRSNYMSLSHLNSSGQVLYVRQFTSDGKTYYSLYSPRYHRSLAWNKDTASSDFISPYYLDTPKSVTDTQFVVTPYLDDINGCYVTFHPRALLQDHPYATYTPAPKIGASGDNILLRQYNSEGSWNHQLLNLYNHASLETDPSYFAKTRWQLANPSFVPPAIAMDPEGVVSLSDISADQLALQYTIQYRINGSSVWTNYDPASKPVLSEGDVIVARTIPTPLGNADYFNPSPETDPFTARKVVTPTLSRSGNEVVLESPTATGNVPVVATIYYNLNSLTDPSDDGSSITFTAPSDILSAGYNPFKAIAYAPNCLKSDVLNINYQAQLDLSLSASGSTVSMSVSNEGLTMGSDYQIFYTVDGSVPSTSSALYTAPVSFSEYALVRAKAFPLNAGYTESDIKQLRINGTYFTITCIVDGDTNFLLHSNDNHIFNANKPDLSAAWNGPIPSFANPGGDYFTGYFDNFYLNIVDGNLTTTTTTTTTKWIYDDASHSLREASAPNRYVVFDKSEGFWTVSAAPNADQISAVCFPTIYRDHPYQVEVDAQALALNFFRIQRHDWVDNLDKGDYASMKTRYDMNGNWTSLIEGDTADFIASISLQLDSAITPEHVDAYIFNSYADSASYDYDVPSQWWHYFAETGECYNNSNAFVIQRRDTVSRADDNTHFEWSHSGNTYFSYLSPLGTHGDTLRIVRNNTVANSPDFSSTLSVSTSYNIPGASPVVFPLLTGHLYAESAVEYTSPGDPGNFTIRNFKDQDQYLAVIPDSLINIWLGLSEVYISGRPRIAFNTNYDLNAVWKLKASRNYTNNHRILHINNAAFTKDSVFWLTNQPYHATSDTCLYLWDPTSPQEFNWRLQHGSTALPDTSMFFEFMFRRYNNGSNSYYYTISPYDFDRRLYNNKPLCNEMRAEAYSRLSLSSSAYRVYPQSYIEANPNAYLRRIHPVWTYSNWGEGHASDGAESFKSSRWFVETPEVLQPVVVMNPSGVVSISNPSASVNPDLSGTMTHYYTTNGSEPTTSSDSYDPDHKPVLTLGQTLKVFTYVDGLSSPVTTFTPSQSEPPLLSMDEATHLLYISYTDGDTVITSLNNGTPEWNSVGPSYAYYDDEPLFMAQSDIIQARSFRHNYFQSDMVEYHFDQTLQVTIHYTDADETTSPMTPPSISLSTTNGQGSDPVPGFFATYWTTDPDADLEHINPSSIPDNIHLYDGSPITGTDIFPKSQVTSFRAVAIPVEALFYSASDIVSKQVAWGYSSTDELSQGSGIEEDPYLISTVGDLIIVAKNTKYRVGARYKVVNDIDATGIDVPSIANNGEVDKNFKGWFDGDFHVIKGLTKPLFETVEGARLYNLIIDNSHITNTSGVTDCGAIASQLLSGSLVWNCNILNSDGTATVHGSRYVGGIAGYVAGGSKVVNCSNFATVSSSGDYAGGVAGYLTPKATSQTIATTGSVVYNCTNYGNLSATTVGPVVAYGQADNLSVSGTTQLYGVNTFCYYLPTIQLQGTTAYNCALTGDERYFTRFEFYRSILNSNLPKCSYLVSGSYTPAATSLGLGKWVLDTAIAPYPIVLDRYDESGNAIKYPSIINPDYANASPDANPYEGKRLGSLQVTMNRGSHGAGSSSASTSLVITDMDTNIFDFNYYKIQLPYYQDFFQYNFDNEAYIVTGWEITSVTGGTTGSYATSGDNAYNFADRNCTQKDSYSATDRVFPQGGFYNVPEGVTAITITAHWAKAVFLSDATYDRTYPASSYGSATTPSGTNILGNCPTSFHGNTVYTSLSNAVGQITTSGTVYDQAIVLVGNVHQVTSAWQGSNTAYTKPYTIMSIDEDNDHEPDYCFIFRVQDRNAVNPIRFDFLPIVPIGTAQKPSGTQSSGISVGMFRPRGHFELTETSLSYWAEFEYDHGDKASTSPLIINSGLFDQFVTSQDGTASNMKTNYIQLGGHCYFVSFAPGCHSDNVHSTKLCPVSVTGGEYESFYLSGSYRPETTGNTGKGILFANGGFFHNYASGGQQQINDDVIVKVDHIIAREFCGGGINSDKPITGNIDVTIDNSLVNVYAGGPKFGDMQSGKTVTTHATNTTFGLYFGAGYGGSSLYKYRANQAQTSTVNLSDYYAPNFYTGTDGGIAVDYSYEFFQYSGHVDGSNYRRIYRYYATLSKANTNNVSNTLTGCTVNHDFYGAGYVGAVNGNVSTVLESTVVNGNAFGAGYSASIPTCQVYAAPTSINNPVYNAQTASYTKPPHTVPTTYIWDYTSSTISATNALDKTNHLIRTNVSLDGFGMVTGNVGFTITGNSVINGHVFGGGDASEVKGDIDLKVLGNTHILGSVFGGGNTAKVAGSINVQIGDIE